MLQRRRSIPLILAALLAAVLGLLLLLPPEATLGSTIRIVLLHGALARAGLVAFAAAALMGVALLARPGDNLGSWTLAAQWTALTVWFAAAATSAVATYLSWGVVIAWGEPRTQGTIKILALAVLLLALVLWIREHRFLGLANVVLGAFSWWVVLRATSVQHPENPIGSSPSAFYRIVFGALVIVLVVASALFARWIRRPGPAAAHRGT